MCIRVPLSVYGRASWFSCHVYIGFLVLDTIDLVGLHPPAVHKIPSIFSPGAGREGGGGGGIISTSWGGCAV